MSYQVLKPFPTPSKHFEPGLVITAADLADAPREPQFYVDEGYLLDVEASAPTADAERIQTTRKPGKSAT